MNYTDIIIGIVTAILLSVAALRKNALTVFATITAACIVILISFCTSYREVIFLAVSYLVLVVIDALTEKKSEKIVADVHKKHGARTVVQLLANGGAATVAVILYKVFKNEAFLYVYVVCVIEACADSIASDIGVLSKKPPVSILTFKRVQTGLSGGVSLLGLSASLVGCVFMAALSLICIGFGVKNFALMAVIPFFGMILDSVIGASLQVKYKCAKCGKYTERAEHCGEKTVYAGGIRFLDNSAVNLLTNIITGIIGYIIVRAAI